jgi:hypothetical protein
VKTFARDTSIGRAVKAGAVGMVDARLTASLLSQTAHVNGFAACFFTSVYSYLICSENYLNCTGT